MYTTGHFVATTRRSAERVAGNTIADPRLGPNSFLIGNALGEELDVPAEEGGTRRVKILEIKPYVKA